jgi:hypothetical protein
MNDKLKPHVWKPGQSGNPAGRKPGDRNKFGAQFIADFYADWLQHGADAIEKLRLKSPKDYVKVAAGLLPRELHVKAASIVEGWNEDEIKAALEHIRGQIAGAGVAAPTAETTGTEKPDCLH